LGTVRRPPRGVSKREYASRDFFDLWLPELAPSPALVSRALRASDQRAWLAIARRYRAELNRPATKRLVTLLSALSHQTDFSVGCYCADPSRCHRSVLAEVLREHGAMLA
jgi:uncharacterized protein YeaO (DUF488 family)